MLSGFPSRMSALASLQPTYNVFSACRQSSPVGALAALAVGDALRSGRTGQAVGVSLVDGVWELGGGLGVAVLAAPTTKTMTAT